MSPTSWYDEWKTSPPEEKVYTYCDQCGHSIFTRDEYIRLSDGTELCGAQCFGEYVRELLGYTEITAE